MKTVLCRCGVVVGLLLGLTFLANADDAKQEAIKKDRQRIEGTWRIVALEINGNTAAEEDARKLVVVNGPGDVWKLLSEGNEVARGTNSLDPTTKPKAIDFTITEGGGKGSVHLGIYELTEKSRKLCFAPAGKPRPTEFSSPSGSELILVTFAREK